MIKQQLFECVRPFYEVGVYISFEIKRNQGINKVQKGEDQANSFKWLAPKFLEIQDTIKSFYISQLNVCSIDSNVTAENL